MWFLSFLRTILFLNIRRKSPVKSVDFSSNHRDAASKAFLASLPTTEAAPAEETPSPTLMDCVEVKAETSAPVPWQMRGHEQDFKRTEYRLEIRANQHQSAILGIHPMIWMPFG